MLLGTFPFCWIISNFSFVSVKDDFSCACFCVNSSFCKINRSTDASTSDCLANVCLLLLFLVYIDVLDTSVRFLQLLVLASNQHIDLLILPIILSLIFGIFLILAVFYEICFSFWISVSFLLLLSSSFLEAFQNV